MTARKRFIGASVREGTRSLIQAAAERAGISMATVIRRGAILESRRLLERGPDVRVEGGEHG